MWLKVINQLTMVGTGGGWFEGGGSESVDVLQRGMHQGGRAQHNFSLAWLEAA
jgi:hypothetical protein